MFILNLNFPWTTFHCLLENPALWLESRSWDSKLEITARKSWVVILIDSFKTLRYIHGFEGNSSHVQTCKSVLSSFTTGCISCQCLGYVDLHTVVSQHFCSSLEQTPEVWEPNFPCYIYLLFSSASFCYMLSTRTFLVWPPIWHFFLDDHDSIWKSTWKKAHNRPDSHEKVQSRNDQSK